MRESGVRGAHGEQTHTEAKWVLFLERTVGARIPHQDYKQKLHTHDIILQKHNPQEPKTGRVTLDPSTNSRIKRVLGSRQTVFLSCCVLF